MRHIIDGIKYIIYCEYDIIEHIKEKAHLWISNRFQFIHNIPFAQRRECELYDRDIVNSTDLTLFSTNPFPMVKCARYV